MPDDDAEGRWWERYGIDPTELTADVEASIVGHELAQRWLDAAGPYMLRFVAEVVAPDLAGLPPRFQVEAMRAVGTIFRRTGEEWERRL